MASLLRMRDVSARLQAGKSKVYSMIRSGEFPAPIKIGSASRWVDEEVEAFIRHRESRR
ncbi:helix-turn-helix transcriptional regulator [Pseudomonas sp. S36]|uniref:helix-turn-helix transcriptional regulator n=1 Tax=Pseudomonas sp. S36 TaxID=2767447 RepID=UPI001911DAAB|nr:AlpA family phage regulatory protein [Pseudomonas sp. S36]